MIGIYHTVVLIYVIFVAYQSCISQTVKLVCMTVGSSFRLWISDIPEFLQALISYYSQYIPAGSEI